MTVLAGIVATFCEQGPSLQQYFVEKMDDLSFLIVNLPIKIDNLFKTILQPKIKKRLLMQVN